MAQFLLSVYSPPGVHEQEFGPYADEAAMQTAFAAVGEFNASLQESGAWVFACGLTPPSQAVVVDGTSGAATTAPGPLPQGGDLLGGFWVVEAADLNAAAALAARGSQACGARIEVRPLQGE